MVLSCLGSPYSILAGVPRLKRQYTSRSVGKLRNWARFASKHAELGSHDKVPHLNEYHHEVERLSLRFPEKEYLWRARRGKRRNYILPNIVKPYPLVVVRDNYNGKLHK